MTRRTSYQLSILFNAVIFVLEAFVLTNKFLCYIPYSTTVAGLTPYKVTELYQFDVVANICIALACFFMMVREIRYLRNKRDYRRVNDFFVIFKLSAIILGMITFFMAMIYYPMFEWKNRDLTVLLYDIHYTLWAYIVLPWLALASFVFFDRDPRTKIVKFLYVWILPAIYVGAIMLLTYYRIIKSPHSILDLRIVFRTRGNLYVFIYVMVGVFVGSYILGFLLLLLRNYFAKQTELAGIEKINDGVGAIDAELVDKTTKKEVKDAKKKAKELKASEKQSKKDSKNNKSGKNNKNSKKAKAKTIAA